MKPRPRRGDMWECPKCGAMNESGVATCMNACRQDGRRVRGPLATPPPTEPDPPKKQEKR